MAPANPHLTGGFDRFAAGGAHALDRRLEALAPGVQLECPASVAPPSVKQQ